MVTIRHVVVEGMKPMALVWQIPQNKRNAEYYIQLGDIDFSLRKQVHVMYIINGKRKERGEHLVMVLCWTMVSYICTAARDGDNNEPRALQAVPQLLPVLSTQPLNYYTFNEYVHTIGEKAKTCQ